MSVKHDRMPHSASSDEAFVFAEMFGWTCSICAPLSWSKDKVEAFAGRRFRSDGWESVDLQKLFGQTYRGGPTPSPCNAAPAMRQHWFLLRNK